MIILCEVSLSFLLSMNARNLSLARLPSGLATGGSIEVESETSIGDSPARRFEPEMIGRFFIVNFFKESGFYLTNLLTSGARVIKVFHQPVLMNRSGSSISSDNPRVVAGFF